MPKSRRIVGVFMLTTKRRYPDEDKQRIGPIYQQNDWRAMARGKMAAGIRSRARPGSAAVEQALERCAEHDSECHIYAISNFRVADEK